MTTESGSRSGWESNWLRLVWLRGLLVGVRLAPFDPLLGLRTMFGPVGYWRTAEFQYVLRQLQGSRPGALFDLGSPKLLSCLVAESQASVVVSADLWRREARLAKRLANGTGGSVTAAVEDGQRLPHGDNTFEAAVTVSVLEHIPDGGDSVAMCELARVVRSEGLIVGTVPFASSYRETYVEHDVYSRRAQGEKIFYQRHYDLDSLRDRLVGRSALRLLDLEIWGERLRLEDVLASSVPVNLLTLPIQPLLARCSLRRTTMDGPYRPKAAFFTIQVE